VNYYTLENRNREAYNIPIGINDEHFDLLVAKFPFPPFELKETNNLIT